MNCFVQQSIDCRNTDRWYNSQSGPGLLFIFEISQWAEKYFHVCINVMANFLENYNLCIPVLHILPIRDVIFFSCFYKFNILF